MDWTPAELLSLIHNAQGMPLPFGFQLLRENLLGMVRFLGLGFFDLDNFQANFDSKEFIDLLDTAMLLQSYVDIPFELFWDGPVMEVLRMEAGDQILSMVSFANPSTYQMFMESLDDSFALGLPTATGGEHIVTNYSTIGIGTSTNHTGAAWEFLRSFLLPSASEFDHGIMGDIGFPIRIDLFNELIEDVMTPRTFVNTDGETIEYPRETLNTHDGSGRVELRAMKPETANSFRALIESAVPAKRGIGEELWAIIEGDLAEFYAGARSAEETARIIQNRAERWLSEQQLLVGG